MDLRNPTVGRGEIASGSALAKSSLIIGHAGNPPGQGPFLTLTLTIAKSVIAAATYETYQCPGCHACGKAICELVCGRSVDEARGVNWETLTKRVGPLPRNRSHCYGLALVALAEALKQLDKNEQDVSEA